MSARKNARFQSNSLRAEAVRVAGTASRRRVAGPKCWPLLLASTRCGPGQEGQAELADLDLITIDQHRRIHRLPVDIGAVEATDIDDAELALLPLELGRIRRCRWCEKGL
jgi:hypothetical protein